MTEFQKRPNGGDWLALVPAGGLGTRLGKLTEQRAKPAVAVSFEEETNEVTRMIDIPLRAIKAMGGRAVVSRCYRPETLDFVSGYDHVSMVTSRIEDSPIDTMRKHLGLLREAEVDHIGLIPADTDITPETLEQMRETLDSTNADAVLLATRSLPGHNPRPVDGEGLLRAPGEGEGVIGDLGIHMFRRAWLLGRLEECIAEDPDAPREVWQDIYNVNGPAGKVRLLVPEPDLVDVDMGTLPALRRTILARNAHHVDGGGNVVFPGARLHEGSIGTIALPNAVASRALRFAMIPENTDAKTNDDIITTINPLAA